MAEKNEAEDGSSISLKSPCHMKWDRQQNIPYFTCFLMSQKCKFCFLLYLKEIYAQFVETNVLVKHNIYHELKLTIMDLDLQITWKHPVFTLITWVYCPLLLSDIPEPCPAAPSGFWWSWISPALVWQQCCGALTAASSPAASPCDSSLKWKSIKDQ